MAMQAVRRAVDIAEGGRKARPVTDAEAAKGRLDYVQVRCEAHECDKLLMAYRSNTSTWRHVIRCS